MRQSWLDLTMIHWPVDPDQVASRLPGGLRPDTFAGSAWVGLVPFSMRGIGLGRGPGIPYLGSFPETNIRTYVRGPDDRPGVWFDSLDISRLLPVLVARVTYRIPYMWARMSIERSPGQIAYRSRRRWPAPTGAGCVVEVRIGDEIPPGEVSELEHFLTARWGLWTTFFGTPAYAPVHHERWPLHRAELLDLEDSLAEAAGYEVAGDPLVHYSPGVRVRIGVPRRAQR